MTDSTTPTPATTDPRAGTSAFESSTGDLDEAGVPGTGHASSAHHGVDVTPGDLAAMGREASPGDARELGTEAGGQPDGPARAAEPSADPRVDDALSRLAELDRLPLPEQVEVFTDIHRRLAAVLADPDSRAQ